MQSLWPHVMRPSLSANSCVQDQLGQVPLSRAVVPVHLSGPAHVLGR